MVMLTRRRFLYSLINTNKSGKGGQAGGRGSYSCWAFVRARPGSAGSLANIGLAFIQVLTLSAGCAPNVHQRESVIDEAEYVPYLADGTMAQH
jgi:hypothetical protein